MLVTMSAQKKTKTAESTAKLNIVIDRMHMKGHIDAWCKKTCDPKLFPEIYKMKIILKRTCVMYVMKVNTGICEQIFLWLSGFCHITKHMNRETFVFFILYIL